MVWTGICYFSIASLFCILPIVIDLFKGFRKEEFWFPSKYFSLNPVSIIAISVLMILPMDLYSPIPNWEGQVAMVGSMAFLSTMVAHMLPSLACLNNKRLLVHVIFFAISVITVIVICCMQLLNTGTVIHHVYLAWMQVGMLVYLFLNFLYAAIAIPPIKQHLESEFQEMSKRITENQTPQDRFSVEKLTQVVTSHWILAETVNPEYVMAATPLSCASGVICVIVLVIYVFMAVEVLIIDHEIKSGSEYRWSIAVIVATQCIGVVVGSIAPISRLFIYGSLEASPTRNWENLLFFDVEKYWKQMLDDGIEKDE